MLMDSISHLEEDYFNTQEDFNEVLKRSYYIFENKTNNINKELDSIKEFFRFLLSKVNINETFASEINNYNNCELEKNKNSITNNIHSSSSSNIKLNNLITQNQKIIVKNNINGNVLIEKYRNNSKSHIDLNNEENLFNKNLNNRNLVNNPSQNSSSFNKLLNTNPNTDSSQKLPKIVSKLNDSTVLKSNFEKFISTPNNRLNNVRNFYMKHNTNIDENENRLNINAETISLSVTNNSNFPINVNYSPLLNNKNSNSVSNLGNFNFNNNNNNNSVNLSLSQKKGDFSFKNNILKENQKSTMKLNLENSESRKKLDLKEKEFPASSIYSNSVNSNSNSKIITSSKFKIDTNAINSKLNNNLSNSNNNLINLKKNSSNKSLTDNVKFLSKAKDLTTNLKDKASNQISNNNANNREKQIKGLNELAKRDGSEMNKTANTMSSVINNNHKIDLKKILNSSKKNNENTNQPMKNHLKDSSGFQNKNQKQSLNNNASLKDLNRNKNNENALMKSTSNSKAGAARNKPNESDIFNNSNFSSINNSRASSSNYNFNNNNKINKETLERLAEDLYSDRESKKENKSDSKHKEFRGKNLNSLTQKQEALSNKHSFGKSNVGGHKVNLKSNFPEPSPASNNPIMKHITPSALLDNRKFSILEIQGAESLNNLRDLIEKNNREVQKKGSNRNSTYKNISENSDSNYTSNNNSFRTCEFEEEKNSILESLPNLKLKSLFLVLNCELTPLKTKIMLLHSCPDFYKSYPFKKLLKYHRVALEANIEKAKKHLTDELSESNNMSYETLETNFKPSRTAINNLNFISKKDSEALKTLKIESQSLVDFVNLIYIMFNLSLKSVKKEDLLVNLYDKLFPKLKVDHIKSLFANLVSKTVLLSEDQITQLIDVLNSNQKVLDFNSIANLSKPLSFLTFIIKEITEFNIKKSEKGILIVNYRKEKIKILDMMKERDKISNFLDN